MLDAALGRLDAEALARDVAALVRVPSVMGDERAALERLGELAGALGLEPDLHRHDLAALRAHPDHPGEEAPRSELYGLTVTVPGTRADGPRLAIDGHVDVVPPGSVPWAHGGPWSGAVAGGFVHGRGSVDMKGSVVRVAGVPWGADMRLWCARGIPCVMAGPPGIALAHAVDERAAVADLVTVARVIVRVVFGLA